MTRREAIIGGVATIAGAVAVSTNELNQTLGAVIPLKDREPPRCPKCLVYGDPHKVYAGMMTTTLVATMPPYWDEDGNYHVPCDPNVTTQHYSCSNGHSWAVELPSQCARIME